MTSRFFADFSEGLNRWTVCKSWKSIDQGRTRAGMCHQQVDALLIISAGGTPKDSSAPSSIIKLIDGKHLTVLPLLNLRLQVDLAAQALLLEVTFLSHHILYL